MKENLHAVDIPKTTILPYFINIIFEFPLIKANGNIKPSKHTYLAHKVAFTTFGKVKQLSEHPHFSHYIPNNKSSKYTCTYYYWDNKT